MPRNAMMKLISSLVILPFVANAARFNGCSADQQSQLNGATVNAQRLVASASSYINSHTSPTPRYTTWFGVFTSARHNIVASHYNNINGNDFSSFTYDCTCTNPGNTGHVYPNQFGQIYLCNAFWVAPMIGTDSKAGVLVGLASQFIRNGGTKDYAHGQTACRQLATTTPDAAVMNADSHQYFAENNPPHP